MDIKFEGDINEVRTPAQKLCRNIFNEKGYTNCRVKVEPVGQKGDNYVANVKRFSVQQDGVNNGKPFKMVGKFAPDIQPIREAMNTAIMFRNEIIAYENLLPKFDQLQDEANIPKEDRLVYPACYGTIEDDPEETIFLEDIKESGYVMLNRFVSMTDGQIKLALNELAKFHSLSYVLNIKEPKTFDNFKKTIFNMWILNTNNKMMDDFLDMLEQDIEMLITNEEYKKRMIEPFRNMMKITIDLHEEDLNSKYSIIVQGDCWTNNMMFKLEDNKAKEIIMLDYQMIRISSPVADILYLLLNCTDYKSRMLHFHDWLDYYYESLDNALSNHGLQVNAIYPRDKLDGDLQRYGKKHFSIAIILANMLVREKEDVIDFKEKLTEDLNPDIISVNTMRDSIKERYRERIEGLIKSGIELGYL